MNITRQIAREIVFPVVVNLQLEKLFSFSTDHNKLILVYHGVVETPDHSVSVGPVAVKQFKQHLAYFKKNFDVVSLDDIFKMYRGDFKPAKKTIAITFDDGYENNYLQAAPVLAKYNFHSTMFIISQAIEDDKRLTWYDYFDQIKSRIQLDKIDLSSWGRPTLRTAAALKDFIKTLNISQRNVLFAQLNKQIHPAELAKMYPREHWKLMDKNQLKKISESKLIEIGAHTHNHPNLGQIDPKDAKEEVVKCKSLLEATIQKEVRSIAFPDGNYTDEVKGICLNAGYKNLLAVDYRCGSDANDKSILPRYCLSSTTTFESNMIQVNRRFKHYGF